MDQADETSLLSDWINAGGKDVDEFCAELGTDFINDHIDEIIAIAALPDCEERRLRAMALGIAAATDLLTHASHVSDKVIDAARTSEMNSMCESDR